ncbi:hypothetical protein I5S53_08540 [Pseudomonas juntendi]|uniref:hypothetical protein n=1 Tax=Pseudomonas juntendi TaxID=2666183 RepID=UPI0018D840BB|nr:hypothetical protein [Pseudomonas juntendi]MBH3384018.1 hypothetical protein [Pseudomonas juntendi]MDG9918527.1 hypothetical protein [Pseudomonas juntendi]MDH0508137.1 hypothetical protein [Pseudomonas juntendi]MDH1043213.1 hypothetical protein [Pseudomonas juntendi]
MDITTAYKLHKKHFGSEATHKVISEVDQTFIDKCVNGIVGRGHDPREMLKLSNTHLIREIGKGSECSKRIFKRSGLNSLTWFFPAGFKQALAEALNRRLRSSMHIEGVREDILAIDLDI